LEAHTAAGKTPIVVYPETLRGNPFQAAVVARYILNFPGKLGGDSTFAPSEHCYAYSETLRRAVPDAKGKLFLPVSDPNEFSPPEHENRSGSCFYAGKYQHIHRGELFEITKNSTEIVSNLGGVINPTQPVQTRRELVDLFRKSEVMYCYENSSLALEALLCGCPVVFLPNPHFTESIGAHELGTFGQSWGTAPEDVQRARETVHLARRRYLEIFAEFEAELAAFVAQTQEAAAACPNRHMPTIDDLPQLARLARPNLAGAPPKQQPAPPPTPWLPQQRWLPAEQAWLRERLDGGNDPTPTTATVLILQPNASPLANATATSMQEQIATLRWHCLEVSADGALLERCNRSLSSSGSTWVGIVDAGDQLAADAWARVAMAMRHHPDWQLVYTDEDTLTADGQHVNPHCKPDFKLDYLRSLPYIGGLLLIRRDLFEALGGFDPAFEGAEDYDLVLRAWEHLQATGAGEKAIGHVAEVLYHRAQGSGHTKKSVPEILAAGQAALQAHFQRLGIAAEVQPGPFPPAFRVRWPLPEDKPLVSILVPTRNQLAFLQRCVESLIEKTKYPAYEVIVIDNDSDDTDTCRYLDAIEAREAELGGRLRVLRQPGPFNFSAMNNAAARAARGDYLLLLNNDTAALHDEWLDEMMSHAVRPDVGIVGAKLLYPDGKIQHAGVILGLRGPAEHPFIGRAPDDRGYFGRAQLVQDLSAVTGACLLVRRSVYEQVGGLDETDFKVSYNDIDLCLKVREAGLRIVFTPFALLLHEGSASQKGKVETAPDEAKLKRFAAEKDAMYRKWLPQLAFDPAYNRHLSLASTEFLLDDQPCLSWDPEWRPRPRILVHPADREGCGEYRIISPMRALNRAGLTQGWETMRLFEPAEMQRMDPDVLVVQRQMEWPQIDAIERHGRYHRAFRVFEIDDLITNLPVKSVHKKQMHKDITKRFRKAAGLCHRLVVATEPLAQAYAGFADEVVVCPNHVEGARWGQLQPPRAERTKPRVGWAGGIGHTGDLELIADVVRDTAGEIDWVFFGMCPDSLKGVVKEFHPGVPLDQYAAKLASLDLDLAVAPLEDNPFNDAKSHLRLLEYGILGYPVICSDLTPYQGDFPVTRVANRYRDWMRAIREALADRDALRAQGDALRDKVRADWVLEDHLDRWMKAWTP
jgi:GT2 family glycosyltransferase